MSRPGREQRGPRAALSHRALLLLMMGLAACAGLPANLEPPRITLADLKLQDASFFEQRYRVALRVQNPNPFPLPIEGLDYALQLNGTPFARGVSDKGGTVPAYGETVLDVSIVSNLADTLRQLRSLSGGRVEYALAGGVRLAGRSTALPFRYTGEIDLRAGAARPSEPTPAPDAR